MSRALAFLDLDADLVRVLARGLRRLPSRTLCLERRRVAPLHSVRTSGLASIRRTTERLTCPKLL